MVTREQLHLSEKVIFQNSCSRFAQDSFGLAQEKFMLPCIKSFKYLSGRDLDQELVFLYA